MAAGTTSYANDFVAHALPQRTQGHAAPYQAPSAAFDGVSTYRVSVALRVGR